MNSDIFLEGRGNGNDEAAALNQIYSGQESDEYAAEIARQVRAAKERVINNMTVEELEALDKNLVATKKQVKQETKDALSKVFAGFLFFLSLCSFVPGVGISWTAHIIWMVIGILCASILFLNDGKLANDVERAETGNGVV